MRGLFSAGASAVVVALAIWLLATGSAAIGDPYDLNEPPDCSNVTAQPSSIRPGTFTLVTLTGATDPDPGDTLTYEITDVFQDEPVGPTPDARRASDPRSVFLRGESDPRGTGRFYTINYTVTDQDGASCSGSTVVAVAPVRRKGPAPVNEGPLYNSFTGAPA